MRYIIVILFSAILRFSQGQDGFFKNPPAQTDEEEGGDWPRNPQWPNGSTQTVEWGWNTQYDHYYIFLLQIDKNKGSSKVTDKPAPLIWKKKEDDPVQDSLKWIVSPMTYDLELSEVFFFEIIKNTSDQTNHHFRSHYFNMTSSSSSSSVSQTPTASTTFSAIASSNAPSSVTDEASSNSAPAPTEASAAPNPGPTTNTGDKNILPLALGIGIGVGVPLVLLVGILVGLRTVRARRADTPAPLPMEQAPQLPPKHEDPTPRYSYVAGNTETGPAPVELESPRAAQLRPISELY